MIKAIQTYYKGYRFRSRLEARWAYYFDKDGTPWEYEPEGFDLGYCGRYLPDFYLPEHEMYVEVKRKQAFQIRGNAKRVYVAGKINLDDPESCGTTWFRRELSDLDQYKDFANAFDSMPVVFKPGFEYTGPFYSDNHGCYNAHRNDLSAITHSDFLFAWITTLDCFGTIAEIGFASGIGKPVYIGYPTGFDASQLWFVEKFAQKAGHYPDVRTAWDSMIGGVYPPPCLEETKVIELSKSYDVALVMGDPVNASEGCMRLYKGGAIANYSPLFINQVAARAARSARFEHGDRGAA